MKPAVILPILLDVIVPIGGYFLLHALGMSDFWALTIAGAGTGVAAIVNTVRKRRLDSIGLLIVLEVALSVALLFLTRDPRILLLKPAFYTAVGGVFVLLTCVAGRPLVYETGKPFATKGDPVRLAAYEESWRESPRFRQVLTGVTVGWGIGFLLVSVATVAIVLHFPPDQVSGSFALSQLPSIAVFIALIAFTRLRVRSIRPIVDERMRVSQVSL
ncbi:MAG TPA: VC0807 family protein [Pseudonocardiaceae bacterium]|jgi:hypothetical protein